MLSWCLAADRLSRVRFRCPGYDSQDYLEGLDAFAQKRQPIFRGT